MSDAALRTIVQRLLASLTLDSTRGTPLFLRSGNGPEFVSRTILECISAAGIGTATI
ncbi:hypothetical protein GCM10028796_13600 [Ramlibacter monticola]|uniref:Uncharacterized protein n=1 Tax=Ramlibacter monticola TaxID=1926872 RepID=A0A937CRG1_9BURK|nr:hypothetical protein [Ramlibacter monticola]MBL0390196.1 hypothetical protein [Ramlibacter monticola]